MASATELVNGRSDTIIYMKRPIVRVEAPLPSILDVHDDDYGNNEIKSNGVFHLINRREVYMKALLILYPKGLMRNSVGYYG